MKMQFLYATVAAVALASAPIGAQSTQPSTQSPSTQTPSTQSPSSSYGSDSQTKTITGCVTAGPTSGSYMLTDSGSSSSTGSSTSSTSTPSTQTPSTTSPSSSSDTASSESGKKYTLVPSGGDVDLSKYVGQRVQITGKPADSGSGSSSASSPSSTSSPSSSSASSSSGTRFQVQSVRVLSQTCS